jgi:hypothetical protein
MEFITKYFQNNSLTKILLVALLVRLLAVCAAPGYMMHDDHFLTVEPASSWAVGMNFNDWYPDEENKRSSPEPISFFYPGALMLVFKTLHFCGLHDPSAQMWVMRLLHALFSLLTVLLVYRITISWSDKKSAIQAGLLMALLAITPNFSVRNLVEMVCMVPLLTGFWWLIKANDEETILKRELLSENFFWGAAIMMGLAVGVRFQLGLAVAVLGVVLWIQNGWKTFIAFGSVSFAVFFLTQLDDVLLWGGRPFQHLMGYFSYNKEHALHYPGSPFTYLSFIGLYLLPPLSIFLLIGNWKIRNQFRLMTWPMWAFLVFHIIYPNRQERFILPALPLFLILGTIGWNTTMRESSFWIKQIKWVRALWILFWTINTIGLIVLSTTFSKKARVQSMEYLYNRGDCKNYVLEYTHQEGGAMLPQHYSSVWTKFYYWNDKTNVEKVIADFDKTEGSFGSRKMKKPKPNYYLFYDGVNLEERIRRVQDCGVQLAYLTTIESGWFDALLHRLNPKNTLERIHIYQSIP